MLVGPILIGELQDGVGANGDLVPVGQVLSWDALAVQERSVGRFQVDEHELAVLALDRGVLTRHPVVDHPDVGRDPRAPIPRAPL